MYFIRCFEFAKCLNKIDQQMSRSLSAFNSSARSWIIVLELINGSTPSISFVFPSTVYYVLSTLFIYFLFLNLLLSFDQTYG